MNIRNYILISVFAFTCTALAQDSLILEHKKKTDIVEKVAAIMQEEYVFAEVGEKMATHIKQLHKNGEYSSFSEIEPFCAKLTSDLREICNDQHIFVFYSPEEARETAAYKNQLPPEEIAEINEQYKLQDSRGNFGFSKVEILGGNIGYFNLDWFSSEPEACEKVISTMAFLADTDAIIIDFRNNGGGGGEAGNLLMSYFFGEEKVQFSGAYFRKTNKTEQSWSAAYVPGKRMPDVDIYILTSSRTFSAAEDFSYSLQALERATIIGENTKGGAHPVDVIIVKGAVLTQVSIGNSVNPITGTNWEKTGVIPDIKTKSENALKIAHITALKKTISKETDAGYKDELQLLLRNLEK